ncbi:MAG: caspase family protein [Saprospiraceae bacterium]
MTRFLLLMALFIAQTNIQAQCIEGNCIDGKGKFLYSDQSIYEGSFANKRANGYGICTYSNGNSYKGQWKNHTFEGKGILTMKDGTVRAGVWENGKLKETMTASEISFSVATRSIKSTAPKRPNKSSVITQSNSRLSKTYNQSATKEDENPTKIWAIIVGVATYNHMPSLNYTDDDAYKMYAFLRSPEGGGVPDEQMKVLVDEGATRKNIMKNMTMLFEKADSNDVILFYFSGHGLKNAFLPMDFDGHLNKVKHSEIKEIFKNCKAKYKLCIADACHAGGLTGAKDITTSGSTYYYEAFKEAKGGTAFMLSSKAEEISIENAGLRQGIFTHFLIKGLKGNADQDNNHLITISEVYDYVKVNVKFYTSNYQNPVLYGDYDDKMPISIIRSK